MEAEFKKKYREEIDSGEADIVNLDTENEAQQFWVENELPLAPTIVLISDNNRVLKVMDAFQELGMAQPPDDEIMPPEKPDEAETINEVEGSVEGVETAEPADEAVELSEVDRDT